MKISVITASYNYGEYIKEAIESVLAQSYQDWELIVVDDGSSDDSVSIIEDYCKKDSRIKLFFHPNRENKGLKETLLLGLKEASGEWVAFLESDDLFCFANLSKKVQIANQYPNVKLIFNKVDFFGDEARIKRAIRDLTPTSKKLSKMKFPKNMFYDFYTNNMILTFSAVMVKKEELLKADFNTPVDALLDWWLWIHLAYGNEFYYINESLTKWRLHKESYIQTHKRPVLYLVQVLAYQDIYQKLNKPFELGFFIFYSSIVLFFVKMKRFFTSRTDKFFNIIKNKSFNLTE